MKIVSDNKKARFEYFLEKKFDAGLVLAGSEVKSIRDCGMSINESFILIKNNEAILKNSYIKPYSHSTTFIPELRRDIKLLLNKKEINELRVGLDQQGYTIIPVKVYFKGSLVKIEIALAKGKHLYDKRDTIKERDIKREIDKHLKNAKN